MALAGVPARLLEWHGAEQWGCGGGETGDISLSPPSLRLLSLIPPTTSNSFVKKKLRPPHILDLFVSHAAEARAPSNPQSIHR